MKRIQPIPISLAVALLTVVVTGTVIVTNPVSVDAKLIFFWGAVVTPPLLAIGVSAKRRRYRFILTALVFTLIWVIAAFAMQNRILAAPIYSIRQPTVLLLYDDAVDRLGMSNELDALPSTIEYHSLGVHLKRVHVSNVEDKHFEKAIKRNNFVRSVVKISSPLDDRGLRYETIIPLIQRWIELGVPYIDSTSDADYDEGYVDETRVVMVPGLGASLTTHIGVSPFEHRLTNIEFFYAPMNSDTARQYYYDRGFENSAQPHNVGFRTTHTDEDSFRSKTLAAVISSYVDFSAIVLGQPFDCDVIESFSPTSKLPGFGWYSHYDTTCMSRHERVSRYLNESLPEYHRESYLVHVVETVLRGETDAEHGAVAHKAWVKASEVNSVRLANHVNDSCGSVAISTHFEGFVAGFVLSNDAIDSIQCYLDSVRGSDYVLGNSRSARPFAEDLSMIRVMRSESNMHLVSEGLGIPTEVYCRFERNSFLALVTNQMDQVGLSPSALINSVRQSVCSRSEPTPRLLNAALELAQSGFYREYSGYGTIAADATSISERSKDIQLIVRSLFDDGDEAAYFSDLAKRVIDGYAQYDDWCIAWVSADIQRWRFVEGLCELLASDSGDVDYGELENLPGTPILWQQLYRISQSIQLGIAPEEVESLGGIDTNHQKEVRAAQAKGDEFWQENLGRVHGHLERRMHELVEYYPELRPFEPIALIELYALAPKERIELGKSQFKRAHSPLWKAALADAYLESGENQSASELLAELSTETNEFPRRDYYASLLHQLDPGDFCLQAGPHRLGPRDIQRFNNQRRVLTELGMTAVNSLAWYLYLVGHMPPIDELVRNPVIQDYTKQVYSQIDGEFLRQEYEQAPGSVLRLVLLSFLLEDKNSKVSNALREHLRTLQSGVDVSSEEPAWNWSNDECEQRHETKVPKDLTLESLCEARSCLLLGERYLGGQNARLALTLLRMACADDVANGCAALGWALHKGVGAPKNDEKAVDAYEKACRGGSGVGCNLLAELTKVTDPSRAAELFIAACHVHEDTRACANLGLLRVWGELPQDDNARTAQYLYIGCVGDGAGNGSPGTCRELGDAYLNGSLIEKDVTMAIAFHEMACSHPRGADGESCGRLGALSLLGKIQAPPEDRTRFAVDFFTKACDLNDSTGCNELGMMYAIGRNVGQDYEHARKRFRDSCRAESNSRGKDVSFKGCANLAVMNQEGWGGPQDSQFASELLARACSNGLEAACDQTQSAGFFD